MISIAVCCHSVKLSTLAAGAFLSQHRMLDYIANHEQFSCVEKLHMGDLTKRKPEENACWKVSHVLRNPQTLSHEHSGA